MAYDASKITVLKGLEAVRKRPAMYVGSNDKAGLHQIFYEVLDNAVDEALAGYANVIVVILHEDDAITVADNGRGIPVDVHPETGKSALETVMTVLHAGGKFDSKAYKVSGGLHGVGVSCTNALSVKMITTVKRGGKIYQQEYSAGKPTTELKVIGKTDPSDTGTIQYFKPDPTIFTTTEFDPKIIRRRILNQAYLTSNTLFIFVNKKQKLPSVESFYFHNGLISFVKDLAVGKILTREPFYVKKEYDNILVEAALIYTDSQDEIVKGFANNIYNSEGGTHVAGFRAALTQAINKYALANKLITEKQKLSGEDIREGLVGIISVKLANPQYEGQTKMKLNNPEVKSAVQKVVSDALYEYLQEHPKDAKTIIQKAVLAQKARKAAKAARNAVLRKSGLSITSLPGKLADCSTKDKEKSELFVVEGDSAGGSAKQARDREFQAVLPLSGKPINSEKNRLDRVMANDKLADLVKALGCGIGENINLDKLRYGKIIIMTDADVDGMHIVTLVLTFFYRFMRPLIEAGKVYIAQPPLFKVEIGKQKYWFLSEKEKDEFIKKMKAAGKKIKNVQRFKGLGEMNPEQLWETTMNPETRVLKQVTIKDAEEANKIFDMLMGTEVPPRRRFIQQFAKLAVLDV